VTPDDLLTARSADWHRLEHLLSGRNESGQRLEARDLLDLAMLYRSASADAARARTAGSDDATLAYLDGLLARAHNLLYRAPPGRPDALRQFFTHDLPRALRRNATLFAAANLAFYGPFLFGVLLGLNLPAFAPALLGEAEVRQFREMYRSAPSEGRTVGTGSLSVSFYIQHNTSIAFEVFACGIFAGLGSVFMLVYQGLVIGTVFGMLAADQKAAHLLTFTCGHSAWELTGIVLAGTAGLRMGGALVSTGGRTRLGSLRAARREVATLVLGAASMLAIAASIEGLWSPSPVLAPVKWAFAVLQIGLVTGYFTFVGRARAPVAAEAT
jgi:uncharacterized membrane protein SpoIIM required for sporulation